MGGIFLCCRESEFSYAARLGRELELTAGLGPVWIIDRGLDPLSLRTLAQEPLDAVLVVIGPEWLTGHAEKRHWIHDPEDAVRRVMANALQTVVLVIPVLVGGGEMPVDDELPPELKGLARCHALRLTDEGWSRGVDELVARLKFQRESLADRRTRSAPSWARSERPEALRRETRTPGTGPL